MSRQWLWAIAGCAMLLPSLARADDPAPTAERIKSAAAEYDAGRRAYTDNKFEEAAVHFENAYHDAPNAQTLRNAIRARRQAGQLARAATLAALAESKYASDEATATTVKETLADAEPKLHRVVVICDPECGVAADGRVASLEDSQKLTLFFDPGSHALVISWSGERSKEIKIDGKAGAKQEFTLQAPPMPVKPPDTTQNTGGGTTGGTTTTHAPPPSTKPLGPALFIVGTILTVGAGGVLIWSGVDTLNNPGTDVVKQKCAGLGESCPQYQQGLSSQLRTNVLIGVTAGLGVLTGIVGIFLTQWSSPKKEAAVRVLPSVAISPAGGSAGLEGSF